MSTEPASNQAHISSMNPDPSILSGTSLRPARLLPLARTQDALASPADAAAPGWAQGADRLHSRWFARILRHPGYSLFVLGTLVSLPRMLWETAWLGSRKALLRQCLRLRPEFDGLFSEYDAGFWGQVFLFDEYELGMLSLPPDAVVLDVGANVGFFSWKVHSLLPNAQVFAFEPQRDNLSKLRNVCATLGMEGAVVPVACSDAAGTARLYLHNTVTHSLDPEMHPEFTDSSWELVPVTTLDSFCADRGIGRIDLIKIDVEGLETHVLQGARHILARTQAVVLEYHSEERLQECQTLLAEMGFACRQKSYWGPPSGQEGLLLCSR